MRKTQKELANLQAAFTAAAAAMREEMPDVWAEAAEIWRDDEQAVRFMARPNMNLNGATPAPGSPS